MTRFFRNPEAFAILAQDVLPSLLQRSGSEGILRAWVVGCQTGEEAYSIAILLLEAASAAQQEIEIQVLATDIDDNALAIARAGIYPDTIEAEVSPARLQRFFTRFDDYYEVVPHLRDCVSLSTHRLFDTPPSQRLDLVSCRNPVIYLRPDHREKLVSRFHRILREGGILFLGASADGGDHNGWFATISAKWRIYIRIAAGISDIAGDAGDKKSSAGRPDTPQTESGLLNGLLRSGTEKLRHDADELDDLFKDPNLAVLFLDLDFKITRMSPAIMELCGLNESDEGLLIAKMVHKFPGPGLLADVRTALMSETSVERKVESRPGIYYKRRVLPVYRDKDLIDKVIVTFNDISERRQVLLGSGSPQIYAPSIMGTVRPAIVIFDRFMVVAAANLAFHAIFGTPPDDVKGRLLYDLADGQLDIPALRAALAGIVTHHSVLEDFEIECETRHLGWRTLCLNARRISGSASDGDRPILMVVEDITERQKDTETTNAADAAQQQEASAATPWLPLVNHELRQPLQTMALLQALLALGITPKETPALVEKMGQMIKAMSAMLSLLVDLDQLESGDVEPAFSVFPISIVFERLSEELTPLEQVSTVDMRIVPSSALVYNDLRLVDRLIQNLLYNALKYISAGRILLGCRRRGQHLYVQIWCTEIKDGQYQLTESDSNIPAFLQPASSSPSTTEMDFPILRRLAEFIEIDIETRSFPGEALLISVKLPIVAATPASEDHLPPL